MWGIFCCNPFKTIRQLFGEEREDGIAPSILNILTIISKIHQNKQDKSNLAGALDVNFLSDIFRNDSLAFKTLCHECAGVREGIEVYQI